MKKLKKILHLISHISKGFTLIEVLVVAGIFIILTTIVLSILVTVLRGTNKSDSITLVRQNGTHTMSQIIRTMRFAKSLDYPSPAGGTSPACSGSGITVQNIRITSIDLSQSDISCPTSFNYPNYIALNSTKLTNSNTVVVKSCSFICAQPSLGPPTIRITFSLSKINSSGLLEDNTTIPFQSSVTLRNISGQ